MSNLKIILKGLALCYYKTDADGKVRWRVVFPFDQKEHRIGFSWNQTGGGESDIIELAYPNRTIRLETENAVIPRTPSQPNFASFIDMNDLHDEVEMTDGWENVGVIMYVDDAVFSTYQLTDRDFYLTLRPFPYPFPPFGSRKGRIGEIVGAEINLNEKGNVKLIVDDEVCKEFNYQEGIDYQLTFDNDCDSIKACDGNSDFPQYYQIIEDVDFKDLQYDLRGEILPWDLTKVVDLTAIPNPHKKEKLLDLGNPLILCGGLRVSSPNRLP